MKTEASFNQNFRNFESDRELLRRHGTSSNKAMRLAKAAAYRMASAYVQMQKQDHNRLMGLIRSTEKYATAKDPVAEWLDDSFAPLGLVGCEHYELIKAIHEGMTRGEYMAQTPALFLSKRRGAKIVTTSTPLPAAPSPTDTPEKAAEYWRLRAEALESRLKEVERESREDKRRLALLEREIERIRKISVRAESAT